MNVRIDYIDHHWDNYQGGSGKSFKMNMFLQVPDSITAGNFFDYIHEHLSAKIKRDRPYQQTEKYVITKIEVL